MCQLNTRKIRLVRSIFRKKLPLHTFACETRWHDMVRRKFSRARTRPVVMKPRSDAGTASRTATLRFHYVSVVSKSLSKYKFGHYILIVHFLPGWSWRRGWTSLPTLTGSPSRSAWSLVTNRLKLSGESRYVPIHHVCTLSNIMSMNKLCFWNQNIYCNFQMTCTNHKTNGQNLLKVKTGLRYPKMLINLRCWLYPQLKLWN